MTKSPVLYTFRRCPYAMRVRLAIAISQQSVEYREITLRDKPSVMLAASPKGTVPVLVLPDGQVIDESLDIMRWALNRNDPDNWLQGDSQLIHQCDNQFKFWLDRYKYADRYPEQSAEYYRQQGETFLSLLESLLQTAKGLSCLHLSVTDYGIAPFVRQFAHVDKNWFYSSPYPNLIRWLDNILGSELFESIMEKRAVWQTE
ncbi:glutathione S-transferase [Endozoicomonas montiporae]|uniref:Glutathione S-transferase n=2 Tax=Endozoicomonas montiporae TaxID=1027273 RepID=A0A081N8F6_9GAMM|nr:glutathione S-transferase [Endozoicomonas montiporae]AMO55379.1 glutathione S-transferase domain-containing protein [Endozoicomonas montiporae CL-33]KEQ14729.1 glutathione S-transferase [Endozoicomonas montiporae]